MNVANFSTSARARRDRSFAFTRFFCLATTLLVSAAFSALPMAAAAEAEIRSGLIGPGTSWETPWRVTESGKPGPTVVLVAGLHGNEPAGFLAAEQIMDWPISRGRLVVLPKVNRLGLAANTRWFPETRNDPALRDLNRNFPKQDRSEAVTPLCQAVWKFVSQQQPDWFFDLHEGFDVHRLNSKSVGSSVIAFPESSRFAKILLKSVNDDIAPERQFDLLANRGPIVGSLARACGESLGAQSFILETTFKSQPISLRTRQHRRMVSTALQQIGIIDQDYVDLLTPPRAAKGTRVALFDDSGANEAKVLKVLDNRADVIVRHVGPGDLRIELLRQFDVIIFPGGSGSKQGKAIGERGRDHVRQFARGGGGIIGICAGAYLCSSHYTWSLNLMNAAVFNKMAEIPGQGLKSMWYRGPATDVDVEVTRDGKRVLGIEGLHSIRYQNGPILSPGADPSLPSYQPLAFFRTENGIYQPQQANTMIGSPAVVACQFGEGRVVALSPHFESTKGCEAVILRVIEHVCRKP